MLSRWKLSSTTSAFYAFSCIFASTTSRASPSRMGHQTPFRRHVNANRLVQSVTKRTSRPVMIPPARYLQSDSPQNRYARSGLSLHAQRGGWQDGLRVGQYAGLSGASSRGELLPPGRSMDMLFVDKTNAALPGPWQLPRASVTVSIAAESIGIFRRIVFVNCALRSAVFGKTVEWEQGGRRQTSGLL